MSTAIARRDADRVLSKLRDARASLQFARTAQKAKASLDVIAALRRYAQHQRLGHEVEAQAYEVEIRALINLGEVLAVMTKAPRPAGPGRGKVGLQSQPTLSGPPTYKDLGLEKTRAYLAQQLAALPEKTRDAIARRAIALRDVLGAKRLKARTDALATIARGEIAFDADTARYPIVYADPPWRYEHVKTESRAIENQYPTMALEAICALPVATRTTDDAVLFLWATSPKLAEAIRVVEAWGFTYRTCAVWDKGQIGMGYYFRQQHELLLVATKGDPPMPPVEARPASVIYAPRGGHSVKPAIVYTLIEAMYPTLPRIELFARTAREGWTAWGNQATGEGSPDSISTTPMASRASF